MRKLILTFISALCLLSAFGQATNSKLQIFKLTNNFYVYTTYKDLNGSLFPSNSMYLVTDSGVVMFDTPWDSTQFQPLLDSISTKHHKKVVLCIATHFHEDRTAGLTFLQKHGVKTYTSQLTYKLCKERNLPQAQFYFTKDTVFNIGNYAFETFYPGQGHTKDNIVIWFGKDKILYGGCFIKSTENNDPGNIADANLAEWGNSIKNTIKKYNDPAYVIPGHFGWTNNTGLKHTLELIEAYNKKNHS